MILHIEDDAAIAELARHAIGTSTTMPLLWLGDGQLALDFLLRKGHYAGTVEPLPALVLLDLHIPSAGGLEVLRQAKASPQTANIPIVVLSSSEDPQDLALSRQYGANAYLVKPLQARDYVATVRDIMRQWLKPN